MNLSQLVPAPARRWYETEHGRKMVRYSMVSVLAMTRASKPIPQATEK